MADKNWVSQDRLDKYKQGLSKPSSPKPNKAAASTSTSSASAAAAAAASEVRSKVVERAFERWNSDIDEWEAAPPSRAVAVGDVAEIRCVSYNVWFVDRFFDERRQALCAILERERPHVICLQEITERFLHYISSLPWVQAEYLISDSRGSTGTPPRPPRHCCCSHC
jgi:hypothetical protein